MKNFIIENSEDGLVSVSFLAEWQIRELFRKIVVGLNPREMTMFQNGEIWHARSIERKRLTFKKKDFEKFVQPLLT